MTSCVYIPLVTYSLPQTLDEWVTDRRKIKAPLCINLKTYISDITYTRYIEKSKYIPPSVYSYDIRRYVDKYIGPDIHLLKGWFQHALPSQLLYIFHNEEFNIVKIGISKNPSKRKKEIEHTSGLRVVLLDVFPLASYEHILHDKFKKYRRQGEWFDYSGELKDFISNIINVQTNAKRQKGRKYLMWKDRRKIV